MARAKRATRRRAPRPRTGPRIVGYAARSIEGWIAPGGRMVSEIVRWSGRAALERLAIRVQLATGAPVEVYAIHAERACQERDQAQGRLAGCALESERIERIENRALERELAKARADAERERAREAKRQARTAKALAKARATRERAEARARAKAAPKKAAPKKAAPKKAAPEGTIERVTAWPRATPLRALWTVDLDPRGERERPFATTVWAVGGYRVRRGKGPPIAVDAPVWVARPWEVEAIDDEGAPERPEQRQAIERMVRAAERTLSGPRSAFRATRAIALHPWGVTQAPDESAIERERAARARSMTRGLHVPATPTVEIMLLAPEGELAPTAAIVLHVGASIAAAAEAAYAVTIDGQKMVAFTTRDRDLIGLVAQREM